MRTSLDLDDRDGYLENKAFSGLMLLLAHAGGVSGKSVCEIGAGDFLSSGLGMLAAGASRYAVIDRFPGDYSGETARRTYGVVRDNWERYFPEIQWDDSVDPSDFPDNYSDRVELVSKPIETADVRRKFDVVCSFQVGEHVSDIQAFADVHNRLLAEGGVGLHRVDFGPHDVWSEYEDPMTFLRLPDSLWRLSGTNRGIPNRHRHHEFLRAFEVARLKVDVLVTEEFHDEAVDYDRLAKRFRSMPRESLIVKTAIYRLTRQ